MCIGDDMQPKAALSTRIGALQANGEGGAAEQLVRSWSRTITSLGLDVFCIGETRISPLWKHDWIESLFIQQGYTVYSHNKETIETVFDPLANSSGVIIGIPLTTPGGLTEPLKEKYGRAIAASIPYGTEHTMRFAGLYGPSGATLYRFPSSP